jgi:FKBP-type peptidyl-prolyl cis-trans isomerase
MAKTHQRVFALIGALLFFASSVGISLFVFWQLRQEQNSGAVDNNDLSNQISQLEEENNKEGQQVDKLEGTKLKGYTPVGESSKLQAVDLVEGTGEEVKEGATVTAHYTGAYASDGTIFQSSKDSGQPVPFGLDQVIPGWTQGVPGMKVGGVRRLIIPGSLAYGDAPQGYVQGSTSRPMGTLVFDIEITAVQNP